MVSSNAQRIGALETGLEVVGQQITGMERMIQRILAESMADFQKKLAENFGAKSAEEAQKNRGAVKAATHHLGDFVVKSEKETQKSRGAVQAATHHLGDRVDKILVEMKELLAGHKTAVKHTPTHSGEEGDGSEKWDNRRNQEEEARRVFERGRGLDDRGGGDDHRKHRKLDIPVVDGADPDASMDIAIRIEEEKDRVTGLKRDSFGVGRTGLYFPYSKSPTSVTQIVSEASAHTQRVTSPYSNLINKGGGYKSVTSIGSKGSSVGSQFRTYNQTALSTRFSGEVKRLTERELQSMELPEEDYFPTSVAINAIVGLTNPKTLKWMGKLKGNEVVVMIDPGATNNFISLRAVEKLGVPIIESAGFGVSLGKGEAVREEGICRKIGLSGALETLCGQGYGAQMYSMLGIYLQSSCIISTFFSLIIAVLWWYTEPILIFLHQSSSISKEAAVYMRNSIPTIFAYVFLQNLLRFLQTQSVVFLLVVCSLVPLALHVGIAYVLVHLTGLGYRGAPLAASVPLWISVVMLALYVRHANEFRHTWKGFSSESFKHLFTNLKLALPSAAMVCLEYWAFEILVLLAGLLQNSETTTSLIAMCVNTEAIAYMIAYGLSAAASTRVSNELGAGNPEKARHAMGVTLKLSIFLGLLVISALAIGHNLWASLFSDSSEIISAFASMTPLLAVSIFFDSIQGVLSGVSRGCGWQHLAMYTNLATFYVIGMPISCLLAFKFKFYSKGLWIGLICGLSCQATTLFLIAVFKKWTKMELSVNRYNESPGIV